MLKAYILDISVQVRGSSMELKLKTRSSISVAKECALPAIFQYWTREHHKRPLNSFQLEKKLDGILESSAARHPADFRAPFVSVPIGSRVFKAEDPPHGRLIELDRLESTVR